MLERFIGRLDPQDLVSQTGDGGGAAGASQLEGGVSATLWKDFFTTYIQMTSLHFTPDNPTSFCIRVCALSGSWTAAEIPVQHLRSPPAADLGTKTLCGTDRSDRDTPRPGETQTEIWENSGQLQGYKHTLAQNKQTNKRNAHLQYVLSFQAALKEAELRLAEIRKAKNGFERRVLKPMKDNRLEMKEPEKVLQYIEDKSKVKIRFSLMTSACAK